MIISDKNKGIFKEILKLSKQSENIAKNVFDKTNENQ